MIHKIIASAPHYGVIGVYLFWWCSWWCSSLDTVSSHHLDLVRTVWGSHNDCCLGASINSDVLFLIEIVVVHHICVTVGMRVGMVPFYHLQARFQCWLAVDSMMLYTLIRQNWQHCTNTRSSSPKSSGDSPCSGVSSTSHNIRTISALVHEGWLVGHSHCSSTISNHIICAARFTISCCSSWCGHRMRGQWIRATIRLSFHGTPRRLIQI